MARTPEEFTATSLECSLNTANSLNNNQELARNYEYISNDQFEEMFPDTESYGQIIAVVDISDIEKVNDNIARNLRKSRNVEEGKEDFYVQSYDELIEQFSSALNIIIWVDQNIEG